MIFEVHSQAFALGCDFIGMNMETRETRELTRDEMAIFLVLEKNQNIDEMFVAMKNEDGGWVLEAIQRRFSAHDINTEKRVMIAVLYIGDGVIGRCAKYIDHIAEWCHKQKTHKIEWQQFAMKVYPYGIPNL